LEGGVMVGFMDKQWTPKQLRAIEMLSSPNEMDLTEIAEDIGVNFSTLWRWRRDPDFQKAVTELAYSCLKDELPKVYKSLGKKAVGGNVKAIELMLKFADNYVERVKTEVTGSMDLGGVSDEELERLINEQDRLRDLVERKE
jgi:hypothetical protein